MSGRPRKTITETCAEIGCDDVVHALGLCKRHYRSALYRKRVSEGLCSNCKRPIDLAYKSYCEECASKVRQSLRKYEYEVKN